MNRAVNTTSSKPKPQLKQSSRKALPNRSISTKLKRVKPHCSTTTVAAQPIPNSVKLTLKKATLHSVPTSSISTLHQPSSLSSISSTTPSLPTPPALFSNDYANGLSIAGKLNQPRSPASNLFHSARRLLSTSSGQNDKDEKEGKDAKEKKRDGEKGENEKPADAKEGKKDKKEKSDDNNADGDKKKSAWSFLPESASSNLSKLSSKMPKDDPEKMLSIMLRASIFFFGVGSAMQLWRHFSEEASRRVTTYSDLLELMQSGNKIGHISVQGTTASITGSDKTVHSLDILSSSDFAARLSFDAQRLGLDNLPVSFSDPIGLSEILQGWSHLAVWVVVLYSMMTSLNAMSSKLSSRLGRTKESKIQKIENVPTRFKDVAGMEEAKAEIVEFVDFLKAPERYTKLGARLPKGALLSGPPGTGKTLLAKATAGEAGVSFYSVSGSEFQQMYVGMGAQRVRELFKAARKNAPAIIFIDEIDAIAKQRSSSGRGSGEREATLNQLLVEMDGFNTKESVVVFAATNRAELLDNAITRAGRFDRKIKVDAPDLSGREQIFNVHLANLKLNHPQGDVAKKIAALTPGMVGADIANVCNEAAIGAARFNKEHIELVDFETAVDRVVGGLEKKEHLNNSKQRRVVAYHEAGHALLGWFLEFTDPLLKVTIIPRTNGALGFAQYLPKETGLQQTQHLKDMIAMALGGRAAEQVVFGKVSTGASDDLKQVARVAQGMILHYGMSKKFANTAFATLDDDGQVWKNISQKTNHAIDGEISEIVAEEYQRAMNLLNDKRAVLESLAEELLAKETLNHEQLVALLGPRPFQSNQYQKYVESRKEFDQDLAQEQGQKQ